MQKKQPSAAPRVFAIITTLSMLVTGLLAVAAYFADRSMRLTSLDGKTAVEADLLSGSLALPVWNFDRPRMEKIMDGAMEDPDLQSVAVRFPDENGTLIGRTRDPLWKVVPLEREESQGDAQASEERSITVGNEKIGRVRLASSARFVEERLKRDIAVLAAAALLGGLLTAAALSYLAWRKLIRPAREMERYLVAVVTGPKGDTEARTRQFSWEMENLRWTLEKMVSMFENRHQNHLKNEENIRLSEKARADEEIARVRAEHERLMDERLAVLQGEKEKVDAELGAQKMLADELMGSKAELEKAVAELEGILTERTSELRRADDRLKAEIEGQTRARDEFFSSREELSRTLNERTEELKSTGEKLLAELSDRKKTEEELLRARDELKSAMAEKVASMQGTIDQLTTELSDRRRSEEGLMRSREELLRLREELEQTLAERTIELQDANERFRADIAERARNEEKMLGSIEEIRNSREELLVIKDEQERVMTETIAELRASIDRLKEQLAESRDNAEELVKAKSELARALAEKEEEMKNLEVRSGRCLEPDAAVETGADTRRVTGLQPGQAWHKVLLVDESEERRGLILKTLAPLEFEMREEDNGEDAVWEYEAWHPTLVIIELGLNGVDGFEVIRRIRDGSGGKEVKILAVAEGISDDVCRKVLETGADDIIANPFRDWMLFEKLKVLLGLEYIYSDEV